MTFFRPSYSSLKYDIFVNGVREPYSAGAKCLVLKQPWTSDFLKVISDNRVSGISLYVGSGWTAENIDFFEELAEVDIKHVVLNTPSRLKNITPLKHLKNITSLVLESEFTSGPDFSKFKELKLAYIDWRPKLKSILNCKSLHRLKVTGYPYATLAEISKFEQLEYLLLRSNKLMSLNGIKSLNMLRSLELVYCSKLSNLNEVTNLPFIKKEDFVVTKCKLIDENHEFAHRITFNDLV